MGFCVLKILSMALPGGYVYVFVDTLAFEKALAFISFLEKLFRICFPIHITNLSAVFLS